MACYNLPATNCTSAAGKFLPDIKELFDNPCETKKRMSMYEIYKRIDTNYYGYKDDENDILEKFEWPAEEDMWSIAHKEWERINSI
jgi:pre-mRNA-splicing factor ISY1